MSIPDRIRFLECTASYILSAAKWFVLLTFLIGLLFVVTQYIGWTVLHDNGYYLAGKESTQESSYLYFFSSSSNKFFLIYYCLDSN